MSLDYPQFESESQEADWLYEHRDLVEAEFLVAGAEGKLSRRNRLFTQPTSPWKVAPEDLEAARKLLRDSGLWIEDHGSQQPQSASAAALERAS